MHLAKLTRIMVDQSRALMRVGEATSRLTIKAIELTPLIVEVERLTHELGRFGSGASGRLDLGSSLGAGSGISDLKGKAVIEDPE